MSILDHATHCLFQIKGKKKTEKLIVQASLAEKKIKAEGSVTFQNIFSSMPDFRDVVSMLPWNPSDKGK